MKKELLTVLVLMLMTLANFGCAHSGSKVFSNDPTLLSGTWEGLSFTQNSRGHVGTKKTVILEVNAQGGISGTADWVKLNGEGGHDGNKPTDHSTESLIGSLNKHDGVFFLVETSETGFWYCRTINSDLVQAHLIQSGPKHVSTFVEFNRVKKVE